MAGLLGKEQECCTDMAHLVEVTRKRSSIRREILFRYPNMDTMAEGPTSNVTATNCVITRTSVINT